MFDEAAGGDDAHSSLQRQEQDLCLSCYRSIISITSSCFPVVWIMHCQVSLQREQKEAVDFRFTLSLQSPLVLNCIIH